MSASKDTFEPNTYEANTFACGTWRGLGAAVAGIGNLLCGTISNGARLSGGLSVSPRLTGDADVNGEC